MSSAHYPGKSQHNEHKHVTATSLRDEVEALKRELGSVVTQINTALAGVRQHNTNIEDIVNGLVDLSGVDAVSAAITKVKVAELERQAEEKKSRLMAALAEGKVATSTSVTPKSILIGVERQKDGTSTNPKHNVLAIAALNADMQAVLVGKAVGDIVEIPGSNGNTFEIVALFDIVEEAKPEQATDTPDTAVASS